MINTHNFSKGASTLAMRSNDPLPQVISKCNISTINMMVNINVSNFPKGTSTLAM